MPKFDIITLPLLFETLEKLAKHILAALELPPKKSLLLAVVWNREIEMDCRAANQ